MRIEYEGRRCLITGGTRGIGAAIADTMEAAGAELIITGTNPDQIQKLTRQSDGRRVEYYAVDFTDEQRTNAFLDFVESLDRIDVLVNNAGINRVSRVDEADPADWEDISAVNLRAPVLLTRTVARMMRRNGYGRIVNIGSIFGEVSKVGRSFYSATKYGIRGLTVGSALDLAGDGVLVNTISPGFVRTDLTVQILGEEEMEVLAAEVPLGRMAEPVEISRVVAFVCSEVNTYLTGQNIIVDGGYVVA